MKNKSKTIVEFAGHNALATPDPRSGEPAHGSVTTAMSCDEFDSILAEVLNRYDLPAPALQHLAECRDCAETLNDFEAIAESVRQLPPLESEPASDLWPSIREVLLREGVIHANGYQCEPPAAKPSVPKLVQRDPLPRR